MKIHHLRSATLLLTLGEHRLLVDPMLGDAGSMPGFKFFGGGRRPNPLVPLPPETKACLDQATGVILTHVHPDHLDTAGKEWIRARGLPVWASRKDVPSLKRKGLDARELRDGALGMAVEVIPAKHGRGLSGWLMGPVSGYHLAHPGEPSVYMTSDAVLTEDLLAALDRLRPDVVIAPAGSANFGLGDILFSVDELVTLARRAPKDVVLNHLEALDHCPTTRAALGKRMAAEGLAARVHIPSDGEALHFEKRA
ncbi:MBL fold metallo-hydrolase [Polyangium jinanense]|uniref:MBL fold metallo-hydrolase n=1 Tax=Polyangium jinanense TaxID=2829994 RepID=A0A9X3XHN2_9BACT|nr:MBL fold metallo-hydrolase [Polyangium jinanense]MDC3962756.1 MBL fold metallo-hydrolase [Polyangium jinanense]MDC3989263.1 MBL fold metallo-hydrolase [Polyangium jinanense]